jgi:phytol kinase
MPLILTIFAVLCILLLSEYWYHRHPQPNELSRKFVHITVGTFVAFWPFFLSWNQIVFLSGAFLVGIIASKYLKIFQAIHSVQRPTWGEIFFAVAVGIIAFVTQSKGIYAAALLQMSLADGLAAIVGLRFGAGSRYKVFSSTKSVAGTLTFFVISLTLLVGYSIVTEAYLPLAFLVLLAAGTSLVENLGVKGLDNIMVPLLIAYMLSL